MLPVSSAPVLDLTATPVRAIVRIDGVSYEMRAASDLTLAQFGFIERQGAKLGLLLLGSSSEAPQDEADVRSLLDGFARMALMAPESILDGLGDFNRLAIARSFIALLSPCLQMARALLREAIRAHGMNSSLVSSTATAARPPVGGATRPSASSAPADA